MSELTYRFKLNSEFLSTIKEFSLKYRNYDSRDFKKMFAEWVEINNIAICMEERRLVNLGYVGDFVKKIYKSARYYYKNKPLSSTKYTRKTNVSYIPRNPEFYAVVENYILKYNMKQSCLYNQFIHEIDPIIVSEISKEFKRLQTFQLNDEECFKKVKKSFNNIYYKCKHHDAKIHCND